MFTEFVAFLKTTPLNSPSISIITAFSILGMGLFTLLKNNKSHLHRAFFFLTFTLWGWFTGNGLSMLAWRHLDTALFWFKIAYSFVTFMACAYYQTYITAIKKGKIFPLVLYALAILEVIFLWFGGCAKTGASALANVGVVWQGMPLFSYFLAAGMFKYLFIALLVGGRFFTLAKKETEPFKKRQYRNFSIFFFLISGGTIEWLVSFGIPLHIAWLVIPPLVAFFAYSVVKYHFLEIDTVIHKTFLWLASIFLLIIPVSIAGLALARKLDLTLPRWINVSFFALFLFLSTVYYNKFRPRIDKLFRRRKYDYLEILGAINQKISGVIDLETLSKKTLSGIKETIYPMTICLFLKDRGKARYYLKSTFTNNEYKALDKNSSDFFIADDSKIITFLKNTAQPVEKMLLKFDPLYQEIQAEAEEFFRQANTLFLFGLSFENELVGLLSLGKRENLRDYSRLDIDALHKLCLNLANPFYTAFHHQDILEGQRLLQEVTLAKHIQKNLLPQIPPHIPGISLYSVYKPSKEIGGDYYDFITQKAVSGNDSRVYIAIGDVSGKGVDAGLVVSYVKASLVSLIMYNESCKNILNILHQSLFTHLDRQKFISLLLLKYLPQQNQLFYSSAGHEHILIKRNGQAEIETLQSGGVILGMIEQVEDFLEERALTLNKGDKILLYTDGATEALNPKGEAYTLRRLVETFQRYAHLPIKDTLECAYQDIKNFISNAEQRDDITLVGIQKD